MENNKAFYGFHDISEANHDGAPHGILRKFERKLELEAWLAGLERERYEVQSMLGTPGYSKENAVETKLEWSAADAFKRLLMWRSKVKETASMIRLLNKSMEAQENEQVSDEHRAEMMAQHAHDVTCSFYRLAFSMGVDVSE